MDYYSEEMNERREKFNRIMNKLQLVLMNSIPEVDPTVYENWQGENPMDACDIEDGECEYHGVELEDGECPYADEYPEIYQWFATNPNDAEFLKDHGQYITYSDTLDTYFLAITHFGTAWDYVDSMVNNILGDRK